MQDDKKREIINKILNFYSNVTPVLKTKIENTLWLENKQGLNKLLVSLENSYSIEKKIDNEISQRQFVKRLRGKR